MTAVTTIAGGLTAGSNAYTNIAGAATTTIKTGSGTLIRITNNKKVASGVITIYDNTSAATPKIGTITNPGTLLDSAQTYEYGVGFATGLTIVTSAADDLTVVWK